MEKPSIEAFAPGEYIREELDARGWTKREFAEILGWRPEDVDAIIAGKQAVTEETATRLADAFGTSPQLWVNLQRAFELSRRAGITNR